MGDRPAHAPRRGARVIERDGRPVPEDLAADYHKADELVFAALRATFEADVPRTLFQTELNVNALRQSYAVSADGQRFLLNTSLEASAPPMTVVLNWPALLKK